MEERRIADKLSGMISPPSLEEFAGKQCWRWAETAKMATSHAIASSIRQRVCQSVSQSGGGPWLRKKRSTDCPVMFVLFSPGKKCRNMKCINSRFFLCSIYLHDFSSSCTVCSRAGNKYGHNIDFFLRGMRARVTCSHTCL